MIDQPRFHIEIFHDGYDYVARVMRPAGMYTNVSGCGVTYEKALDELLEAIRVVNWVLDEES